VRQLAAAFLPATLLAGLSSENTIRSQQAGWRQSGSKLPHSKAGFARKCRRVENDFELSTLDFEL